MVRTWLGEHPQIFMPSLAEPSFFAFDDGSYPPHMLEGANDLFRRRRTTSFDDYLQLFQSAPSGAIRGECSPEYLRATGSAARIAEALPDCRAIFSLRNPVDRVISDWKMCRRDGAEKLGLRAALDLTDERNERGEFGGHYLATSRYTEGLVEFFEKRSEIIDTLSGKLKVPAEELPDRVEQLIKNNKKLTKQSKAASKQNGVGPRWNVNRRS